MFDYFCYTFCHCPYDLANSFNVKVSHDVLLSFAKLFKCFFFSMLLSMVSVWSFLFTRQKRFSIQFKSGLSKWILKVVAPIRSKARRAHALSCLGKTVLKKYFVIRVTAGSECSIKFCSFYSCKLSACYYSKILFAQYDTFSFGNGHHKVCTFLSFLFTFCYAVDV